jgi:hypothetical protein
MKLLFLLIFCLFVLLSCSSADLENRHPSGLVVVEISPDKGTMLMKQNLLHLAQVYDLSPFLFTKRVHIHPGTPHQSHPDLTLDTKNAESPPHILADFLHEELHWWLSHNQEKTAAAKMELNKIYPKAPFFGPPEETYEHLVVCYLEFKALEFYLGKIQSRDLLTKKMKKEKSLAWVYYQILYKDFAIKKVIHKLKLLPFPLT